MTNPTETRLTTPDLHDLEVIAENLGGILMMFTKRSERHAVEFYIGQARIGLNRIIEHEKSLRREDVLPESKNPEDENNE